MRILHTCLRYPPATGGVETYVKEIVERTWKQSNNARHRRDVRVLTTKLKTHGPMSNLAPEQLLDDMPNIHRLFTSKTPFISYPRLQAANYYLKHHNPDIIHGYSFWYHPADIAARYAQKNNLPFIFHPIFYTNEIRQKPIWQAYKNFIGRKTFAAADIVAVISPFEQALIEKENFPVKRFELLPPGIQPDKYTKILPNIFPAKSISGKIVLTVSRLAPGKGLQEAIQAFPEILRQVSDAQLVIVGEDFGAKQSLANLTKQIGISQQVHFLGKLSNQDLVSAFQNADVFLHPSHYEAFGIVLAESLASGTPVVARNATAIPYVAPHEKSGLLFNNSDELISHTVQLLTSTELNKKLATQGHQYVLDNFTWDSITTRLEQLYSQLRK